MIALTHLHHRHHETPNHCAPCHSVIHSVSRSMSHSVSHSMSHNVSHCAPLEARQTEKMKAIGRRNRNRNRKKEKEKGRTGKEKEPRVDLRGA